MRSAVVGDSKAKKFKHALVFVCTHFPLRCLEQCPEAEYTKRGLTGPRSASLLKKESHPRVLL